MHLARRYAILLADYKEKLMDFKAVENKWNEIWEAEKTFKFNPKDTVNKEYILEMFAYPSGANLHMGHMMNYTAPDTLAKYEIMKGMNVFQPMGFDAFGLPAENFALKTGIHPRTSTFTNMEYMTKQLKNAGLQFDWEYTLRTCNPEYYKWTQWLFIQLFKSGLAYQKFAPVNWCSGCNTVLANEQVVDGKCERCDTPIVKKNLTQWFFKITDYADRLLEGLDRIDWPEKTKTSQRNWIGRSVGAEVDFAVENCDEKITVFTSRVDTLYGVTYVVLAPENPLVSKITTAAQLAAVNAYIAETAKKDDITRQSVTLEKTGVFTGAYAIHPLNGKRLPVYIADYVLATYATGAVMGVPAHDERDFEFAKKFALDVVQVIANADKTTQLPYTANGKLIRSDIFDGEPSRSVKNKIIAHLEKLGVGRQKVNYKLRDWSVSRQRYWGCPIPIIHCKHCGAVPVPEKDLPVMLPETMDYKPDGRSPLSKNSEYMNTVCPICGRPATRDPDTLDTFVCSSFYFLRYPCANVHDKIVDDFANQICPVDCYVGGMEHANSHLIYSRFITKFLFDQEVIKFDEPFLRLVHQGMILGPNGQKMSKSKGNIINPDDILQNYGSDALRLYLLFGFNFVDGGPWNDDGLKGAAKFLTRLERIVQNAFALEAGENVAQYGAAEKDLDYARNFTIKEYEANMKTFSFNSAVARVMEFTNALYKYNLEARKNSNFMQDHVRDLLKLLAPFAPYTAEELWHQIDEDVSVFKSGFPECDETKLIKNSVEYVVQINSKIVGRFDVPSDSTKEQIDQSARELVAEKLAGKSVLKSIIIPNKLINFVCK